MFSHEESAGKMKVNSIVEMYKRCETLYNVRYGNHADDVDSKPYIGILESKPYKDSVVFNNMNE